MPITGRPQIIGQAASQRGAAREVNQDTVRVFDAEREPVARAGQLVALADGMGGYTHGELASRLAIERLFAVFYGQRSRQPAQDLRCAVETANEAVYQEGLAREARMGTTLVALHLLGHQATLAHVGDSRVYLYRQGVLRCLTRDHTPVGDLAHIKLLTAEQVRQHEGRSVLNRCLGIGPFVRPDIISLVLRPDDLLLLCSDGLWSALRDDEIALAARLALNHAQAIDDGPETWLARLGQDLLQLARDHGSDDDRSLVLLLVPESPLADQPLSAWPQRWAQALGGWLARCVGGRPPWDAEPSCNAPCRPPREPKRRARDIIESS